MSPSRVEAHKAFPGMFWVYFENGNRKLATLNLTPGRAVYGERLIQHGGREFRLWDPYRSKLAAAVHRGLKHLNLRSRCKLIYLGSATGTTVSHISDIVGLEGRVYCVEFSERVMRELVNNLCAYRSNLIPILSDARHPESYRILVEMTDFIYCDVAQPEQAKVLADNADIFLKPGGESILVIKARSIDVTKDPSQVFKSEIQILKRRGFRKVEELILEPYDKAHSLVVVEYKGVLR